MDPNGGQIDAELARDIQNLCGLQFESSPVPMWIHDRKTLKFLAVNSAALACYEFSRREFLQMTMLDIRPAEDVPGTVRDVLFPHFHDPDGAVRRHMTRGGRVMAVGIKAYKISFQNREAELVIVDVAPHKKSAHSVGLSSEPEARRISPTTQE